MTSLQQPYFLECNRSNSTILSENDDYNAIWSSDIAPFPLLPGDQVSVSSVAIEASSIGTPDTIEFTAEPVKVNNIQKEYVDNKVVLEIGFYLLNANGSYCILWVWSSNVMCACLRVFGSRWWSPSPVCLVWGTGDRIAWRVPRSMHVSPQDRGWILINQEWWAQIKWRMLFKFILFRQFQNRLQPPY